MTCIQKSHHSYIIVQVAILRCLNLSQSLELYYVVCFQVGVGVTITPRDRTVKNVLLVITVTLAKEMPTTANCVHVLMAVPVNSCLGETSCVPSVRWDMEVRKLRVRWGVCKVWGEGGI